MFHGTKSMKTIFNLLPILETELIPVGAIVEVRG